MTKWKERSLHFYRDLQTGDLRSDFLYFEDRYSLDNPHWQKSSEMGEGRKIFFKTTYASPALR